MHTLFEIIDYLRELNFVSVAFRLLCAKFFGGLIGLEARTRSAVPPDSVPICSFALARRSPCC
jgi:hypothetical protein